MLKLRTEQLIKEETINKVQFNTNWYFDIESVEAYLKEDLSDVNHIILPFGDQYKKAATIKDIEEGRKQEPLSEFNQALLKMKKGKE